MPLAGLEPLDFDLPPTAAGQFDQFRSAFFSSQVNYLLITVHPKGVCSIGQLNIVLFISLSILLENIHLVPVATYMLMTETCHSLTTVAFLFPILTFKDSNISSTKPR